MDLNPPTHSLTYCHYVDGKYVKSTHVEIFCTADAIRAKPNMSYEELSHDIARQAQSPGEHVRCEYRRSRTLRDPNYLIVRDGADGPEFLDITSLYNGMGVKWHPVNFETMTNEEQNHLFRTYGCISEKHCDQLVSGQLRNENVNLRIVPIGYHEVYVSDRVPYGAWVQKYNPNI